MFGQAYSGIYLDKEPAGLKPPYGHILADLDLAVERYPV
jgi:hypothetical protein